MNNSKNVPLVGIYTITQNANSGITTDMYHSEQEYDQAYARLVKTAYKDWFGKELEGNVDDAYSKLCDQAGFFDTIHPESSEFEVPWVTEMYETLQEVLHFLSDEHQKHIKEVLNRVPLFPAPE
ncbi:MAG: hypothetical protein ACFHHU_00355 [Porticoccaceae bacterium]